MQPLHYDLRPPAARDHSITTYQWFACCGHQKRFEEKGPDNPTRQLLPIRKDKGGGGGGPRSKTKLCVTKLYVNVVCDKDRWCVCVRVCVCVCVCVKKLCVKDGG